MMKKTKSFIFNGLSRPYLIFVLCLLFLFANLVLSGDALHIFRLYRDLRIVQNRAEDIEQKNLALEGKIQKASDPDFMEEEIRERLDYANEGDLIFIFPENI